MHPISIKLPDPVRRRLDAAAVRRGVARSELVRLAVDRLLAEEDLGGGVAVADLIPDLVGALEASADLSSNPAHMDGFGR